jgi:uncharacterized protein YeaO (DUF488 family)
LVQVPAYQYQERMVGKGETVLKVKHLLDPVEPDDGLRLWVESIGLTQDLREWCKVDQMLPHFGPPKELWNWYDAHPQGYEYFRGRYHEALSKGPHLKAMLDLVANARHSDFTLIHQGDTPESNTAMALYEFLSELEAYVPPES